MTAKGSGSPPLRMPVSASLLALVMDGRVVRIMRVALDAARK